MSKNRKEEKERPPLNENDPLFDIQQAAAMTECTGILPFQIQTEEEGESVSALESIHPIQPPAGKHKAK